LDIKTVTWILIQKEEGVRWKGLQLLLAVVDLIRILNHIFLKLINNHQSFFLLL